VSETGFYPCAEWWCVPQGISRAAEAGVFVRRAACWPCAGVPSQPRRPSAVTLASGLGRLVLVLSAAGRLLPCCWVICPEERTELQLSLQAEKKRLRELKGCTAKNVKKRKVCIVVGLLLLQTVRILRAEKYVHRSILYMLL